MRPISRALLGGGVLTFLLTVGAAPAHNPPHRRSPDTRPAGMGLSVTPASTLVTFRPVSATLPPKPHIPTAADLYPKSLHADELFSYRGRQITTYWRSGRSESVIIAHRAPNLRRIDYLAPDFERGRSVVTDGGQQWQYDPRNGQLLHRRLEPDAQSVADAAESYDLLRANYILGVEPQVRTWAERKVFLLTITRKTNRMLARKLWIDADTGLVLKRENYREDGKPALTIAFSDINYHVPLPRSLFDLSAVVRRGARRVEEPGAAETSLPLSAVGGQLGGAALAPPNLNGYRLVSAALTRDGGTPVLHLRYSDGLTLVSLFEQRRIQIHRPTRVPPSMRRTQIGKRDGHVVHRSSITALNWDTPSLNLTLMGEIAETSLRALASAADPAGGR